MGDFSLQHPAECRLSTFLPSRLRFFWRPHLLSSRTLSSAPRFLSSIISLTLPIPPLLPSICRLGCLGFLQTLAVLEVLHAALGIVPSGVALAFMQSGGRTHFLLAVVRNIEEVQELPSVFITFVAWSISEIIRYSHYALTSFGVCPSWLTYLRYTAFIFLYPIGVFPGEMWLMYQALPVIKQKNLYSNLFEKVSFSYHSFIMMLLVCYPFLWLNLYLHLFKQRKSKLGNGKRKKQ